MKEKKKEYAEYLSPENVLTLRDMGVCNMDVKYYYMANSYESDEWIVVLNDTGHPHSTVLNSDMVFIPAYTLFDMIDLLPEAITSEFGIEYRFQIQYNKITLSVSCISEGGYRLRSYDMIIDNISNAIDFLFGVLKDLVREKYIEVKKKYWVVRTQEDILLLSHSAVAPYRKSNDKWSIENEKEGITRLPSHAFPDVKADDKYPLR